MAGDIDLQALGLGIGVILLLGWFFWHTGTAMVRAARQVTEYLDTRSARLRQRLEDERRHGPPPLALRVARQGVILLLIACVLVMVWLKFGGLASPG